jgi:hypothetical protein
MKPIKEANRITQIWRQFGPATYPIDLPRSICEIVNKFCDGDQLTLETRRLDGLDGALVRTGEKSWCAVINENIRNLGRKNFTVAHEIGHFVGHRHLGKDFQDSTQHLHDFANDPLEKEANEFAAQLLMPQDIIRPYAKKAFDISNLSEVVDELAVSKQAAGLRWIDVSTKLVGFVVARDGFVNWGRASGAALKRSVFFKSGSALPDLSATLAAQKSKRSLSQHHSAGVWHEGMRCKEDVHFALDDFTYSCLEYFE